MILALRADPAPAIVLVQYWDNWPGVPPERAAPRCPLAVAPPHPSPRSCSPPAVLEIDRDAPFPQAPPAPPPATVNQRGLGYKWEPLYTDGTEEIYFRVAPYYDVPLVSMRNTLLREARSGGSVGASRRLPAHGVTTTGLASPAFRRTWRTRPTSPTGISRPTGTTPTSGAAPVQRAGVLRLVKTKHAPRLPCIPLGRTRDA